jgi:hypothetical protein
VASRQAHERHGSPTLRAIVEASQASATASYRAVRQGLYTAQCSGRNALRRWSKFPAAPAVRIQAKAPPPTALFTMGVAIYGAGLRFSDGARHAAQRPRSAAFRPVVGPDRPLLNRRTAVCGGRRACAPAGLVPAFCGRRWAVARMGLRGAREEQECLFPRRLLLRARPAAPLPAGAPGLPCNLSVRLDTWTEASCGSCRSSTWRLLRS